jgi:hypothetical protein
LDNIFGESTRLQIAQKDYTGRVTSHAPMTYQTIVLNNSYMRVILLPATGGVEWDFPVEEHGLNE